MTEFIALVAAILLLLTGLTFLALRRRSEILRIFLTPKDEDISDEFFRRIPRKKEEPEESDISQEKTTEEAAAAEETFSGNTGWGQ